VGLEIHREFIDGDLRSLKMAALPLVAAVGGVVMPALIYPGAQFGCAGAPAAGPFRPPPTLRFAIAVFSFLRRSAHPALRALLLAIAVIDDIAGDTGHCVSSMPTGSVSAALAIAGAGIGAGLLLRVIGPRWAILYALPGVAIWIGLLHAGVHPALTGVILGLLLPRGSTVHAEHVIRPWVVFWDHAPVRGSSTLA